MFYIIPCAWWLKKTARCSFGVWAVPSGSAWCNPWYEPVSYVIICHIPNCCQTGSISMTFLMCKTVPESKCLRVGKIFAFQICSTILTLSIGGVWNGRRSFITLDFLRLIYFCSDFCHPSIYMGQLLWQALHTFVQSLTCPVSQRWVLLERGLFGRVEAACWAWMEIRWRTAWCKDWNGGQFLR